MKRLSSIVCSMILFSLFSVSILFAEGDVVNVVENSGSQPMCGAAELLINEVDYVQPQTDVEEFIEIAGVPEANLDTYEIHLLQVDGKTYQTYSLQNKQMSESGYFVVGSEAVYNASPNVEPNNYLEVDQNNFIRDNQHSGIGIYSTIDSEYCSFINYNGTMNADWVSIGVDVPDREERGCSRTSSFWVCNRPVTPAATNDIVSVVFNGAGVSAENHTPLYLFALLTTFTFCVYIQKNKRGNNF